MRIDGDTYNRFFAWVVQGPVLYGHSIMFLAPDIHAASENRSIV